MKKIKQFAIKAKAFTIQKTQSIKFYVAKIKIRDNKRQEYISKQVFYIFDKIAHNIIVDLF